jgi:hypothetical protein
VALALTALLAGAPPAAADDERETDGTAAASVVPWREAWVGTDAAPSLWSVYAGVTAAPFGAIRDDGWRVRLVSGTAFYPVRCSGGPGGPATIRCPGLSIFQDVLVGYQSTFGPVTVKGFVGGALDGRTKRTWAGLSRPEGIAYGAKAALEVWANLGPSAWSALDLSWSHARDTYSSRLRGGWRLTPALSVGLEGGAAGNASSAIHRAGAFLRYEWTSGEASASAGIADTRAGRRNEGAHPYASLGLMLRY